MIIYSPWVVIWRHCEALLRPRMSDHGSPPQTQEGKPKNCRGQFFGQTDHHCGLHGHLTETISALGHYHISPIGHSTGTITVKGPWAVCLIWTRSPHDSGRYIQSRYRSTEYNAQAHSVNTSISRTYHQCPFLVYG